MHFSLLTKVYWAIGIPLNLALLCVLLVRGRWRLFPVLALWMAFLALRTPLLFLAYLENSPLWYLRVYLVGACLDFILQLALVFEIARIVLRPTGSWVRDARAQFAAGGFAGTAVAAILAWLVSPPSSSLRYVWVIRGNLFTSLVICELFVVMSFAANRLGLGWRSHVMAVGQGLTAWAAIMVVATSLQSWFGTVRHYEQLTQVRSLGYVLAIIWIALQLWRQEPERQPISADLQEYILALHRRVEYDLRSLDAPH